MDNIFTLRPYVTPSDLKDAICLRLTKAKAITSYLLSDCCNNLRCCDVLPYGAVLAIDDYIDEIEHLSDMLEKLQNGTHPLRKQFI